jgi:hypothetical protein
MNYDEALKDLEGLISVTCDGNRLLTRTKLALETAQKEHELLELYRNLEAWVEEYNTADSTLRKQGLLAEIRVARHLIAELESELK